MPCYEPGYKYPESTAILCGIFHVLEDAGILNSVIKSVDYKECGLSEDYIKKWWKNHQNLDRKRLDERR